MDRWMDGFILIYFIRLSLLLFYYDELLTDKYIRGSRLIVIDFVSI